MSELPDLAARWLRLAEGDLLVAESVLSAPDLPSWAACFHAQQAAEKALKAVLTLRAVPFERTHDLEALYERLPPSDRGAFVLDELDELTPWAVEGRYGGGALELGSDSARRLLEAGRRAFEAARVLVEGRGEG
jgi:HEPN domain-containing protein